MPISLLVDRGLLAFVQAARSIDRETGAELRKQTRKNAEPIWRESVTERLQTRIQARVLGDSARVAVTNTNVLMKSGGVGKTRGTPNGLLASGAEFGADPKKKIKQRSSRGNSYTRTRGRTFLLPRRKGYVVFPAAGDATARIAALWVQTYVRTMAETLERNSNG